MGIFDKIFGRKPDKSENKVEKRNLLNMRVGDIVSYDLIDYTVVGLIKYEDSGYTWTAYQLEGDGERIWLGVEQDDALEAGIYKPVKLDLGDKPPRKITYRDKVFYLDEAGSATIVAVEGQAGAVAGQRINYWEYEDESEDYALSVEMWGGDLEVSFGYYIHPRELSIMAGSHN
jgi:hypothetical protein